MDLKSKFAQSVAEAKSSEPTKAEISKVMKGLSRLGVAARAIKLTPEQRRKIASRGGRARWRGVSKSIRKAHAAKMQAGRKRTTWEGKPKSEMRERILKMLLARQERRRHVEENKSVSELDRGQLAEPEALAGTGTAPELPRSPECGEREPDRGESGETPRGE
jgi:hypothetical protein